MTEPIKYGEVKNVREAVLAALQRYKGGLNMSKLVSEASKARYGINKIGSGYHKPYVEKALRGLIRDGLVHVRNRNHGRGFSRSWSLTYKYNPDLAGKDIEKYWELHDRLLGCQDKLSGHGISDVKVSEMLPEDWSCYNDETRRQSQYVRIHYTEVEALISELRRLHRRSA